ncbi:MAG: helix-turn-helix domain-containing protein [Nostocoides sp.]|uniref:helix-turn-helix domain-containing protein n=1 Tax=Nostocoides sp. TaxID=1917966 RepID=UPI003C7379AC
MPAVTNTVPHRAYTREEAADLLRVSKTTILRMLDSGELKSTRPRKKGRPLRISAGSVHRILDADENS